MFIEFLWSKARRTFNAGATIISHPQAECVLFLPCLLSLSHLVDQVAPGPPEQIVQSAVHKLHKEQLYAFNNLSYIEPPGGFDDNKERSSQVALAIFQTNAVTAGEAVGLFPQMARLNHGCAGAFSAVYAWREREGVIIVHALKAIKQGEVCELVV